MIAIRTDVNSRIGMGHIMRCSSIAGALKESGKETCFLISKDSDQETAERSGFPCYVLQKENSLGWDAVETARFIQNRGINTVFLDSYRVTPDDFHILHKSAKLLYLDDCYLFDYDADAVFNYNVEASPDLYETGTYHERKLFLGTKYFPLRQSLCSAPYNVIKKDVSAVLITTGGTDRHGCALSILKAIHPDEYPGVKFILLIGAYYDREYVKELKGTSQRYTWNLEFLEWGQDMARLFSECDLCIAPGSTIIFEALSLNLPCISFESADNQHIQCVHMDRMGMVPFVGIYHGNSSDGAVSEKIKRCFDRIIEYKERKKMESVYGKLFDRKGALRMAEAIARYDE